MEKKSQSLAVLDMPALKKGSELLAQQEAQGFYGQGLATHFSPLNQALLHGGLSKGSTNLWIAARGTGLSSLWLGMVQNLKTGKALWISERDSLFAPSLWQKRILQKVFVVQHENSIQNLRFVLRETLTSPHFPLVGLSLQSLQGLSRDLSQIRKLATQSKTCLVLLSESNRDLTLSHHTDLTLEIKNQTLILHKSKNRPPTQLLWRPPYAHLLSELTKKQLLPNRRGLSEIYASD